MAQPVSLDASSPPPTQLGYDMDNLHHYQEQQQQKEEDMATTPRRGTTAATTSGGANTSSGSGGGLTTTHSPEVQMFVPGEAAAVSPSAHDSTAVEQQIKDEEEDDSWVETSPAISETGSDQPSNEDPVLYQQQQQQQQHQQTFVSIGEENSTSTEPITESQKFYSVSSTPQATVDAASSPASMHPSEEEPWEEIQQQESEQATTRSEQKTTTGPATLETVDEGEKAENSQQLPTTASDFEWIHSPPSEDPTIVAETLEASLALRQRKQQGATSSSLSTSSTAIVVPRGLPAFTKGVKTGLTQLQEKNARRQHEVRTRIHAVECKMARWTANLATERMARQDALQHVMGECVYGPAGRLMERVSKERQEALDRINHRHPELVAVEDDHDETTPASTQPRWRTVDARLTALETQMAQSAHALAKERRMKILSLHDRLVYDILPRLWKDRTAAATQEHVLLERVDEMAGALAARSLQERAKREVSLATTNEYLQESKGDYEERHEKLSTALEKLRAELQREQEARREKDTLIQEQMDAMTTALRDAMLEAVGDPQD